MDAFLLRLDNVLDTQPLAIPQWMRFHCDNKMITKKFTECTFDHRLEMVKIIY